MRELTFDDLNGQITLHFQNQTYAEGLAFTDEHADRFPEHLAHINYLRMCLAARLEDKPRVLALLTDTLASGIWYSEQILYESPSLAPLRGDSEYEALVAESVALQARDSISEQLLLVVHQKEKCGRADEACPTLITLHSNGEEPRDALAGWGVAAQSGWLVAVPVSSGVFWSGGGRFWAQHETAADEIMTQFANLDANYNLAPDEMLLGGFSMGGEIALWMALKGILAVRGFILLGPGGPLLDNPDEWLPLITEAKAHGLRGYVIFSEDDDTIPHECIRRTVDMLNEGGIPTKLELRTGLTHEYPPDFEQVLQKAFAFVLETD